MLCISTEARCHERRTLGSNRMGFDWRRHRQSHQKALETDTRRYHRLPALAAFHREGRLNMNDFGTLDSVLNNFTSAISGVWGPQLFFYLQPVLLAIIVLQFGLVAAEATVERDVPLLISHTMIGLLRIGVVWSIFNVGLPPDVRAAIQSNQTPTLQNGITTIFPYSPNIQWT